MGKHKNIETPEILWQHFQDYKKELKNNPKLKNDFAGKDADEVYRKLERPLTMVGFLCYLDDNEIITDATDYFENKDKRYSDYIRICSRIRNEIKADQIEGGMVGIYNPSITQRLNGLADKIEETSTKIIVTNRK